MVASYRPGCTSRAALSDHLSLHAASYHNVTQVMLDYDGDGDVSIDELQTAIADAAATHSSLRLRGEIGVGDVLRRVGGAIARGQVRASHALVHGSMLTVLLS